MSEENITPAEARKIRKRVAKQTKKQARSQARQKVEIKAKNQVLGFQDFIRTQGVIGLAVGLVLGAQVKAVVDQIVVSFINPLLGIILPGKGNLAEKKFYLSVGTKEAAFSYGAFLSVMISFIVVALLVYYGVKALRLDKLENK